MEHNNSAEELLPEQEADGGILRELLKAGISAEMPKPEFRQALRQRLGHSRLFRVRRSLGAIWVVSLSILWLLLAAVALGVKLWKGKKPSTKLSQS